MQNATLKKHPSRHLHSRGEGRIAAAQEKLGSHASALSDAAPLIAPFGAQPRARLPSAVAPLSHECRAVSGDRDVQAQATFVHPRPALERRGSNGHPGCELGSHAATAER
jgi:hypothetical protein